MWDERKCTEKYSFFFFYFLIHKFEIFCACVIFELWINGMFFSYWIRTWLFFYPMTASLCLILNFCLPFFHIDTFLFCHFDWIFFSLLLWFKATAPCIKIETNLCICIDAASNLKLKLLKDSDYGFSFFLALPFVPSFNVSHFSLSFSDDFTAERKKNRHI